jgi:hypothetical protein
MVRGMTDQARGDEGRTPLIAELDFKSGAT